MTILSATLFWTFLGSIMYIIGELHDRKRINNDGFDFLLDSISLEEVSNKNDQLILDVYNLLYSKSGLVKTAYMGSHRVYFEGGSIWVTNKDYGLDIKIERCWMPDDPRLYSLLYPEKEMRLVVFDKMDNKNYSNVCLKLKILKMIQYFLRSNGIITLEISRYDRYQSVLNKEDVDLYLNTSVNENIVHEDIEKVVESIRREKQTEDLIIKALLTT